ncbi:alpha/beta fold hydrolase [Alcaligenaceae bacterium]|nr:alpha/beta fold hydrolase [Alcaligenaceae bacterium]
MGDDMSSAQRGLFSIEQYQLASGEVLPDVNVSYITLGTLNQQKSNAVLVLHGYTSSHDFVCGATHASSEGSWASLVGPGKAIDTTKYFVIAPNALGSCFGSTGPGSASPECGQPYGPMFPRIAFQDVVGTQYRLVHHLGITRLVGVVGVSMGGFAAWQWGIQYPGFMSGLVVVLSSLIGSDVVQSGTSSMLNALATNPHWNNGWIYEDDRIRSHLSHLRRQTLLSYGMAEWLAKSIPDPLEVDKKISASARMWAEEFDPNSLFILAQAMNDFDVRDCLAGLKAKVLFVLATTDKLFPASSANKTLAILERHEIDCQYIELDTQYGHLASGLEWWKWERQLREFMESVYLSDSTVNT